MFVILSVPSFLMGLLLIMIFANGLGWFPRAQWVRIGEDPVGNLHHAILPAVVIALTELALFTRILRNDLIMTLNEDFILSARAKGMPPWRILFPDALRPSSFSSTEERRVGIECVSTRSIRWAPFNIKKKK